jgi:CBS domain-containing protein
MTFAAATTIISAHPQRDTEEAMKVRDVMREVWPLGEDATLDDVAKGIQATGCEALPIVNGSNGDAFVTQLVSVRDLPRLRRVELSAARGHAVGGTVLDLMAALGRRPSRFPTIGPDATLADAWGLMADECTTHLPVVDDGQVVGLISLVVTFAEFPHRSPAAGFFQ